MAIDLTLRPFFIPPNWREQLLERLQFRTDAIVSEDYTTQTRATRLTPRRSFEYSLGADKLLRQRFVHAAYVRGAGSWYLPTWVDGVVLQGAAAAASDTILATANGRAFVAGGPLLIQSPDLATFELVEIAAVNASTIQLAGALAGSYPRGSFVYPCLKAMLDLQFSQSAFTSSAAYGRVKFNVMEPNPFTAYAWPTTYRGFPVLLDRPETTRDPESVVQWMLDGVDDEIGIPSFRDPVGVPLYRQAHDWKFRTRAEIDRFRGMAYALEGKQKSLWVPTWADDLTLHANLTAGQVAMQVKRVGATALLAKTNRRDVRIQTTAGVYYRRISNAVDPGSGAFETLTLDSALPAALTLANVVQISFMALCRSESDNFEFNYFTGESAELATAWRARQNDV